MDIAMENGQENPMICGFADSAGEPVAGEE